MKDKVFHVTLNTTLQGTNTLHPFGAVFIGTIDSLHKDIATALLAEESYLTVVELPNEELPELQEEKLTEVVLPQEPENPANGKPHFTIDEKAGFGSKFEAGETTTIPVGNVESTEGAQESKTGATEGDVQPQPVPNENEHKESAEETVATPAATKTGKKASSRTPRRSKLQSKE